MASHDDMDDDIYPEDNDSYEPQETKMHEAEDEEEGEEIESDSDDDIKFITETEDVVKTEPDAYVNMQADDSPLTKYLSQKNLHRPGSQPNDGRPSATPGRDIKREHTPQVNIANVNRISTPHSDGRPGTDYAARHTSTLDPMNGNPIHPATGKPILETDLDNDFKDESSKPWRKPGADITDYFNYGFDEFTWASYCLKKQNMPKEIKAINQETEQIKAFMDQMPGTMPGMPSMPQNAPQGPTPAVPEMAGMPNQSEMQQMMEFFKSQGIDPMQMDPTQMSSMMMMGMGGQGMQPGQQPPAGPAGFGGGHQDNFGGRGRGRGRRW